MVRKECLCLASVPSFQISRLHLTLPRMVTAVCSGMIVWFADTNEQLTAMKLLMKNESASETGWWMKMVINTGCFVPSSGLLLHAICQCVIATLHHSLTDTRAHTHTDSSNLPAAWLILHEETVIYHFAIQICPYLFNSSSEY